MDGRQMLRPRTAGPVGCGLADGTRGHALPTDRHLPSLQPSGGCDSGGTPGQGEATGALLPREGRPSGDARVALPLETPDPRGGDRMSKRLELPWAPSCAQRDEAGLSLEPSDPAPEGPAASSEDRLAG